MQSVHLAIAAAVVVLIVVIAVVVHGRAAAAGTKQVALTALTPVVKSPWESVKSRMSGESDLSWTKRIFDVTAGNCGNPNGGCDATKETAIISSAPAVKGYNTLTPNAAQTACASSCRWWPGSINKSTCVCADPGKSYDSTVQGM
jgi:hypothetical protein